MSASFTILHVEDDPNDVLLLQRAFRKAGASVNIHSVGDGDQAVNYLSGGDKYEDREKFPLPHMVLLDLKMPRKSGFEVLAWVRAQPQLRRAVIVVFTSSKHDADIDRAYEIGANSYLVKPVGFDSLVELSKTLMHYWGELNQRPLLTER